MSVKRKMRFRAHDTFFIRRGWLNKGLRNIVKDPDVFKGTNENPMDVLGIGANMVKSLRYWIQAVGLSEEFTSNNRSQTLTDLGKMIFHFDPYIEEIGTLWLLHYKLATNLEDATTWYYFFNEFSLYEFSKDDFSKHLNNYVHLNDVTVSLRSLEDDFNCIINTYVSRAKSNPEKVSPESNIDCPLGDLDLVDIVNKREKIYRKSTPKIDSIPPLILLAVIVEQANGQREIKISSLQNDSCNVGKIFNLDTIVLVNILYKLETMGYINVIRTAGLDVIEIKKDTGFLECVSRYYQSIN